MAQDTRKFLDVKLIDLKKTLASLNKEQKALTSAFAAALYLLGAQIITAAMRMAPVATGYMRQSRFVQKPDVGAVEAFTFLIGFGALYAYYVENVPANHRTGQDRFLASALETFESTASATLKSTTMRLLRAGIGIESVSVQHPTNPMSGPDLTRGLAARRRKQQKIRERRQLRHSGEHAGERQE